MDSNQLGLIPKPFSIRNKLESNPNSQTYLQFAQANTKTKNCKKVCLSANAFCRPEKTKSGQC